MTKVSILGKVPNEKKKIKFLGCLMQGCKDVNYELSDSFSDPSTYDEIILISRNYGDKDVMLAKKRGENTIMFGHFNDGVVF